VLSFVNLCYFRVWHELESFNLSRFPAIQSLPDRAVLLAAMANVLLWGVALTALVVLFRRRHSTITNRGRVLFLLALVVPLTSVDRVVSERYQLLRGELIRVIGPLPTLLLYCGAALLFGAAIWRWHAGLARGTSVLLLIFAPGLLLTFGKAIQQMSVNPALLADRPSPPPSATARKTPRVIWLLFDEWDYRLSFTDRLPDLELPEMDRLTQTSLAATNALPPARATALSIPMLLTGERYQATALDGPSRLTVTPIEEPDSHYDWSRRDSIFTEAHAMHFNTALAGWYLPYCRVIPEELNSCEWLPLENQRNSVRRDSVAHAMIDETRSLFETSLFSPFGQSLATRHHVQSYRSLSQRAQQLISDPAYGVVFVHMPIPHTPFIYDRAKGTLTAENSAVEGYYDALALLDRTIGEFRRKMEAAGQWDSSTVLFTTDHYFRSASVLDGKMDFRVPFLLKLAGQKAGVRYTTRFNTLLTKALLTAVLRGEVTTPEEAVGWLDAHRITAQPLGPATPE
jgi:hypothetical protein